MNRFRVTLARWAANVHALLVQGRGPRDIPADAVEVFQPQGLRAIPVPRAETEALVIELANGERLALLVDKKRDAGAVVPEAGETQLHGLSQPAAVVRIRANGNVEVVSAAGGLVKLQGGTRAFVRGEDLDGALDALADAVATFAGAVATMGGAINTYAGAIKPIADPTNAATPTLTTALTTTLAAAVTALNASVATFKSASAVWLSTKVKGE